jgi:hypothetical protein
MPEIFDETWEIFQDLSRRRAYTESGPCFIEYLWHLEAVPFFQFRRGFSFLFPYGIKVVEFTDSLDWNEHIKICCTVLQSQIN